MSSIDLENQPNPLLVESSISDHVADGLREGSLPLFSAYLLSQEATRIGRAGYLQPAWNRSLSISGVLKLYMLHLCGLAFGDAAGANRALSWLEEDFAVLREIRPHYAIDRKQELFRSPPSETWLREMSAIRSEYQDLYDDDGPFHCEVFPWHYASPEDFLLGKQPNLFEDQVCDDETSELLVKIGVSEWG